MAPGAWVEIDHNEWQNKITGDTVKIDKRKKPAGANVKQSWQIYYNGKHKKNLSSRINREGAVNTAKKIMARNTAKEKKKKRQRKQKLLRALKKARRTAKNRSSKAVKLDRSMFNERHYDVHNPEDVDRWAENPGSGDLESLDTPISEGEGGKEFTVSQLDRRIEAVKKSMKNN